MANTSTKTNGLVVKHTVAILAIVTLLFTAATPEAAQAKTGGSLLALLTNLTGSTEVNAASDDQAAFPVSEDRKPVKVIDTVVTAYNSEPGQTDNTPCITANGHDLCKQYEEIGVGDTIAANGLKFGTRVRFPELYGDKEFVVRDRMNARYGYGRIDVWLPTKEEAKTFGVKHVKMEIYN